MIHKLKKARKNMFVTAKEAAAALKISERFLRQLVAEKRVVYYRLSPRTTRFDLDELRLHMQRITKSGRSSKKRPK